MTLFYVHLTHTKSRAKIKGKSPGREGEMTMARSSHHGRQIRRMRTFFCEVGLSC